MSGPGQGAVVGAGGAPDLRTAKLDRVATTLISAVAAVGGLLAVFGVNNERIYSLLDDNEARRLLVRAGIAAILAICASLVALLVTHSRWEVLWLSIGAIAYVTSLLLAIFAAGAAANYAGRPLITAVEVSPGTPSTLRVDVRGGSLDTRQVVGVQIKDGERGDVLYSANMTPDINGSVEQKVSFPIPEGLHDLHVETWRLDLLEVAPDCASGRALIVCTDLRIP